jgi:hypothetical protein
MSLMNGFDVCGVEPMDEAFFGPAPRFLRERQTAANDDDTQSMVPVHDWKHPIRAFRGWWRRLRAA